MNALRWYAVIGAAVGAAGLPIFQVMSPPGLPAKSQGNYSAIANAVTIRVYGQAQEMRRWSQVDIRRPRMGRLACPRMESHTKRRRRPR